MTRQHSAAQIWQRLLIDLGWLGNPLPTPQPWPIYRDKEPNKPDKLVTVYNDGDILGTSDQHGEYHQFQGVQFRIRAGLAEEGRAKANDLFDKLTRQVYCASVTLDSAHYCVRSFNATSTVLDLGEEPEFSRRLFTINGTGDITRVDP